MNFAGESARTFNKDFVWLQVTDSSSSAIGFYESLGFENGETETLQFSQMKQELRGMFVMKKKI